MSEFVKIAIIQRGDTGWLGFRDGQTKPKAGYEKLFDLNSQTELRHMVGCGMRHLRTGPGGPVLVSAGDDMSTPLFWVSEDNDGSQSWTVSFMGLGPIGNISSEKAQRLAGSPLISFVNGCPEDWVDVKVRSLKALESSYRERANLIDNEISELLNKESTPSV